MNGLINSGAGGTWAVSSEKYFFASDFTKPRSDRSYKSSVSMLLANACHE